MLCSDSGNSMVMRMMGCLEVLLTFLSIFVLNTVFIDLTLSLNYFEAAIATSRLRESKIVSWMEHYAHHQDETWCQQAEGSSRAGLWSIKHLKVRKSNVEALIGSRNCREVGTNNTATRPECRRDDLFRYSFLLRTEVDQLDGHWLRVGVAAADR